jgi:hypothetical protein
MSAAAADTVPPITKAIAPMVVATMMCRMIFLSLRSSTPGEFDLIDGAKLEHPRGIFLLFWQQPFS